MNGFEKHHENLENITSDESTSQPLHHDSFTNGFSEGPQAKRRKFTETIPSHQSTPRPVSPPWKKVAVEGPTSFVEDGRRKSSRTNAIPLEFQPPGNTRQTRAAAQQTYQNKTKFGRSSLNGYSTTPASGNSDPNGRRPISAGKTNGQHHVKSPSKPKPLSPTAKYATSKTYPSSVLYKPNGSSSNTHFSTDSSPSKTASPTMRTRTTNYRSPPIPSASPPHDESANGIEGHDEVIYGETSPKETVRRVKLKVKEPTVSIQHPLHIVPKKSYSSLREWMEMAYTQDQNGQQLLASHEEARKRGHYRLRILEEVQPGGLLSEERCSVYEPDPQDEPAQQYGHHDHLVAHALNFRSLMQREKNNHQSAKKKINLAVMAAWKARQPKTSEDVFKEEYENNRRKYLEVIKDVRRLWERVLREIERRRIAQWQEEQKALGKQRLRRIIEQSDLLIGPRRASLDTSADTAEDDDDNASTEDNDTSSGDEQDSSNMSSSDAESKSDEGPEEDDDAGLSREELLRKYANLPSESGDDGAYRVLSPSPREHEEGERHDLTNRPASLPHVSELVAVAPAEYSTRDMEEGLSDDDHDEGLPHNESMVEIRVEDVDDVLLDDSNESTDMDDDMGDSDDEESDEDGEGNDEEDYVGLLGFFSKSALAKADPVSTDESPASVTSDAEAIETDLVELQNQVGAVTNATAAEEAKPLPQIGVNVGTEDLITQLPEPTDETTIPSGGADETAIASTDKSTAVASPSPSTSLQTPVPSLLRGTLREYQHYGLDWLANRYKSNAKGAILADEMGLGKTIQTIALLAHLAVSHEVWGPHLIIVPTSVMLNWEMEFKKWCPGFKILTYYGTQEERKRKRQGWMDDNAWHVCITSYQLVLQDQATFKRRNWHYMVLDEAHNIKNFKSQRWQTLLSFKSVARLLLTGTPLQNNLTELWSLLSFLTYSADDNDGHGIQLVGTHSEFSELFKGSADHILEHGRDDITPEQKEMITKLHQLLRPYLLRRMKADVEKQMPAKYEHVVSCRLSKRQRILYDGYMALSQTRETLASGNYLSIMNTLMQLRKVCNHPDLFETRSVTTSFAMPKSAVADFEIKDLLLRRRLQNDASEIVNLDMLNLVPISREHVSALDSYRSGRIHAYQPLHSLRERQYKRTHWNENFDGSSIDASLSSLDTLGRKARFIELETTLYLESLRHRQRPVWGAALIEFLTLDRPALPKPKPLKRDKIIDWLTTQSPVMLDLVPSTMQRSISMNPIIQKFLCLTPAVVAPEVTTVALTTRGIEVVRQGQRKMPSDPYHEARMRSSIAFPDKRLLQYDCGKLQRLDQLLRDLQSGGHRALIFTQMTKVLDILEQFLNIHGHRYLRLDGATKVEQRQALTDRFNNDSRIPVFILSSRSGGLGINLTGADTVIFYDLDWNPAMDKQCQDRCHRIGQTRDVHIYRFVSEYTIESNIFRKANQKRMLDDVIIQEGEFTTDYFNKLSVRDMIGDELLDGDAQANEAVDRVFGAGVTGSRAFEGAEEREDVVAAKLAEREVEHADDGDFEEKSVSHSGIGTPKTNPQTPRDLVAGSSTNAHTPMELDADTVEASTSLDAAQSGLVDPDHVPGVSRIGDEDEVAHVDEHMLRFVEWELRDVPIAPPPDKSKKKAKKGQDHRAMRTR